MRLHHLTLTAFGPFAQTAEVDFDALSRAGLFLLSGATGSGKSSVLDAVCFALYGAVPGDRGHAGRLRSDQAAASVEPSVALELTLSGRRLRVLRSPAWRRPKKRGVGSTPAQARVTLTERVDGEWVHLTSRLDEAGDQLSGLLGMSLDQFCQVALLPQGHFQAFLRAKPDERQRLLARLFRTGRFERVEAWLRDHRLSLRRASEEHAARVADLRSRLSEAADVPVPSDTEDAASAADDGSLAVWASGLRAAAAVRRAESRAAGEAAAAVEHEARSAWDAASRTAAERERVVAAAEVVERLQAATAERETDRRRLDLARRAEGLRPLVRLTDERRRALAGLRRAADVSASKVRAAGLDPDDLPGELERTSASLAALTALVPAEERLADLGRRESAALRTLQRLEAEAPLAAAESEALAARLRALTEERERAEVSPEALAGAEREVAAATAVAEAHRLLDRLGPARDEASTAHTEAVRALLDARERLLDLRERRIVGMAAELARALVAGDECPVCGSAEHPRPAPSQARHPDGDAERAAQREVDDAQLAEHALDLRLRELDAEVARARSAAGSTTSEQASLALARSEATATDLRARAEHHRVLGRQVAEASARLAELEAASAESDVRRAELQTSLDHLRAEAARLAEGLAQARGPHPAVADAVAELEEARDLLRLGCADASALAAGVTSQEDAESALRRAALEAGFDGEEAARAAELPEGELAALDRRLREHAAALTAARAVLDEPDAWPLLTAPEPDVSGCEERLRAATAALAAARAEGDRAARTDERVSLLAEELQEALRAWEPVRARLRLATTVSAFAEGKAADNRLQMRLSAYVLAYRLSQVVAAANARLATMSDQRYSLEHVGRRGPRETRGGLSLMVRDDWSGESREPATLSGGESFVVSLALALGLADVVSGEAGGTDLQTLFVDEGFGSLDAETLDDVLDILDTLRESGRAVGVVSHVAEMRDRIPVQLVVAKARSGSTLRVVEAAG